PGQSGPPGPGEASGGGDRAGGDGPAGSRTRGSRRLEQPGAARPEAAARAATFHPATQADLAPSGAVSRVRANLAALTTLRRIQQEQRPATPDEQRILARWSGWGAVPEVFDGSRTEFAQAREQLTGLLTPEELAAAA